MDGEVPKEELGNSLRRDVFSELLKSDDPMTPTELGESLGEQREQIHYHLDILTRTGIVVGDGSGGYKAQELFSSPAYNEALTATLSTLTPLAEQYVEMPEEIDGGEETVLRNCVRLTVAMNVR